MASLQRAAADCQISPEQLVKQEVARILEARRQWEYWQLRAEQGRKMTPEQFQEIMAKVPDAPPMPGDELPEGWAEKRDKH